LKFRLACGCGLCPVTAWEAIDPIDNRNAGLGRHCVISRGSAKEEARASHDPAMKVGTVNENNSMFVQWLMKPPPANLFPD
jgi:hypothetical protein